jgi:acyl dehydratase
MAYAARLFTSHFGAGALLSLSTRFTGIAKRGDRLLFSAQLTAHDPHTASYSLQARTEQGADVLSGTARVALSPSAPAKAAP